MIKKIVIPLIVAVIFASNLGCFISRQLHDSNYKNYPIRDGKSTVYYKNNTKKIEGYYKKGKKEGEFTSWRIDGSLESKITYHNNLKNGLAMTYDEKNKLIEEATYRSDKLDGTQKFFNAEGVVTKKIEWKNGKEVPPEK